MAEKEKTGLKPLNVKEVEPIIKLAIEEDFGGGDMTSELLSTDAAAKYTIISREEIVVCGMDIVREVLRRYDERLKLKVLADDGESAYVGCRIGIIEGPLCSILSAERVMLNFLQRLSGIATTTAKYARALPIVCLPYHLQMPIPLGSGPLPHLFLSKSPRS